MSEVTSASAGFVDQGDGPSGRHAGMTVHEALRRSAEELELRAEVHRRLLVQVVEGGEVEADECPLLDCPHRRRLRETLARAITVLEETRKAFKSRRLETLRKTLIGVLAEDV